ncbi:MAG: DedA family protein [Myxococcaceae bacterium]|nr:DedA family protein [Myxococcaceae bacterium]
MFEQWVAHFDGWAHQLGPYGFLILGLASLVEYVFPPFPGDTIVLMGGAYAVRGELPWAGVLLVTTLGSMVGLTLNYAVGRLLAQRIEHNPEGQLWFGLTHEKIRSAQERMRRQGRWLLAVNRFLPTFRAVLFIAAGAARMGYGTVLLWGTASALAWNVMLMGAGMWVGGNLEKLTALFQGYHKTMSALLVVGLAGGLAFFAWRKHQAKKDGVSA